MAPKTPIGVEIRATPIATGRLTRKKEVMNISLEKKEKNHLSDNPVGGKVKSGEGSKALKTIITIGAQIKA